MEENEVFSSNIEESKQKKKKKWPLFILLAVALLFLLFGAVAFGMNYKEILQWNGDGGGLTALGNDNKLQVDPNAGEFVAPTKEEQEEEGIAIPGWGYISIPAGETDVTVDFPNPESNADQYYLTFELTLKDSSEVLYTSGLVPPGQTIQKITLNRALEEGTYDAIVHVQPYKMDENQTPTNNANMETELVVYNP